MTHIEDAILKRWQQLKEQNVPPRERFNDPTLRKLEAQLKAVTESMKEPSHARP